MVQLNLSSKYLLYNKALGGDIVLASTPSNDSLVIQPIGYDKSKLWYFTWITEGSFKGYLYFHTIEKGDGDVLDVYSDNGDSSSPVMGFHFVQKHGATGQYWMLQDQKDGTVILSNKYVGRDWWMDVVKDTAPPQITFSYQTGMKWTVSEATATPSPSSTSSLSSSAISTVFSTSTSTPSLSSTFRTSSISTGSVNAVNTSTGAWHPSVPGAQNHRMASGTIAGIVVGVLAPVALAFAIAACLMVRRKRRNVQNPPISHMTVNRPVLHAAN